MGSVRGPENPQRAPEIPSTEARDCYWYRESLLLVIEWALDRTESWGYVAARLD